MFLAVVPCLYALFFIQFPLLLTNIYFPLPERRTQKGAVVGAIRGAFVSYYEQAKAFVLHDSFKNKRLCL